MAWLLVLLLLQVTAANSFSHETENFSLRQAIRKESIQWVDSYQLDSLPPLRCTKRTWVITTIDIQEEDKGPFPKYAGQIHFNIVDRKTGKPLDHPLFFKIKVKDINDNAPEFPKEEYSVTIRENHSKDKPVFQVTALDKDEDGTANSRMSYSLSMQTPSRFSIDPTSGSICLSECLDYKTASSFKLLIKASDHGTPQLSSTATVNVAVEDANNHLPVFTRDNYQLQVSAGQDHPAVLRLQVEDNDSHDTPAWRAKYRVTQGNDKEQFTIETDPDTNEGILSIIKPLDYEDDSEMRLVISVANEEPFFLCKNGIVMISSPGSTNTTVNIKVLQSQRAPSFHPPILIVQKEDSMKPGRVFRRYPATYPDGVPNKIKYELAHDPDGWLSVDENSGVLTVAKEFDQESPYVNKSLYTIIVHAMDHGIPQQTGTGTILLYLSDVNDHMPTLVASSLAVCDKKEGTPLIIKAKSALVHAHSGPFTFELAEDSEDVKHNWKLGRNFGESVELLMLRSLPQGNCLVPVIIQDRQGFSTRQNQHVRLCSCPDGHTCKDSPLPQAAVRLGVSSILLCQFYVWRSKSKAIVLPQDGEQTLINYNEESRMSLSQAKLDITGHAALPPVSGEAGEEVVAEDDMHASYRVFQERHLDYIMQTVDEILGQKLYYQSTLEDYGAIYEPYRYAEEGELERSTSSCSVSVGSEDLPADFLNTLGPKFSALEEICQKRFPSLN
ncbi:LOW QUALITY PROTEIN: cadherin-like protein 26 [Pterocles gutturalis]